MNLRVVACLVIGLAPAALAQERRSPSERELAYGRRLADRLDELLYTPDLREERRRNGATGTVEVRKTQRPVDPPPQRAPDPPLLDAPLPEPSSGPFSEALGRGVEVDLGDIRVQRLRFESPEEAQRYLSWLGAHDPGQPVIGELRGDQVVTATGKGLTDPIVAHNLRRTLWDGLPAPPTNDAAFTDFGDGKNIAVSSKLASGPVQARIEALTELERRSAGTEFVKESPTGPRIFGKTNSRSQTRIDEHGASFWRSEPDKFGVMDSHFADVGAHPFPPRPPRRGAAGALTDARGG